MWTDGTIGNTRLPMAAATLLAMLSGCSLVVDGRLEGNDLEVLCPQEPDGTLCGRMDDGLTRICLDDQCVLSECGDGFVDTSLDEQCDELDDVGGDGCEPGSCQFSCELDADCDDGNACTGTETCDVASHTCQDGTPANGASCTQDGGEDGVCNSGQCVPVGCGDGVLEAPEECDDGNLSPGDGCEPNCTFSCEIDDDCDDGDPCTGTETCDVVAHICEPGDTLVCDPSPDACHVQGTCEAGVGCPDPLSPTLLVDGDGDGHADTALGACGSDCDDADASIYEGAVEICGDGKDNNCVNGTSDEGEISWYADCDGDGFALSSAAVRVACEKPATTAALTGCLDDSGDWTATNPNSAATRDCADQAAAAFPGAFEGEPTSAWPTTTIPGTSSWDWNCDGSWERAFRNCTSTICCFFLFPCNSATSCCGGGTYGWRDGSEAPCGAFEWYELCGDEGANSNCAADEFRQQRCR